MNGPEDRPLLRMCTVLGALQTSSGLKADVRVRIDGNMVRAVEIMLPGAKEP
jgi:hypothetical protein